MAKKLMELTNKLEDIK